MGGAERLTAGLALATGVVAWQYALNGVSILIVRQIPAHEALHVAASEQAVAVPAVLCGIAGAVFARPGRATGVRSRTVLAWLVAFVGLLAIFDAVFPEHRTSLVTAVDAEHVHGITKALVPPIAAALVVSARSLARGNRRAWEAALVLMTMLLVLHVERRFDDGAIVTGIVVVALLARRSSFTNRGDPSARPRVLLHAVLAATGIVAYGTATLWVNRMMADTPFTFSLSFEVVGRALTGMSFHGEDHLSGPVADWLPFSIFLLGFGAAVFLLAEWVAPWRYRLLRAHGDHELVHAIVALWGADTLAPFALRADKSYFFSEDRSAFLAYRVVGGVAIVAGDPIGPIELRAALVRSFREFAHARGWRVAVLGVSEECVELYRSLGLRVLYHGDEAVVDARAFSLEGRAIRKVRQSVHRLESRGIYGSRALSRPARAGAPRRARGDRAGVARRRTGTWLGNGDGLALQARRRRLRVRRRLRRGRPRARLSPLLPVAGRIGLVALLDAAPARRAERLHGVVDLRVDRVGAEPRPRARVAELRAVRGTPRAGR